MLPERKFWWTVEKMHGIMWPTSDLSTLVKSMWNTFSPPFPTAICQEGSQHLATPLKKLRVVCSQPQDPASDWLSGHWTSLPEGLLWLEGDSASHPFPRPHRKMATSLNPPWSGHSAMESQVSRHSPHTFFFGKSRAYYSNFGQSEGLNRQVLK